MRLERRAKLWLGLILLAALGLRMWGIGFASSTPVGRPDEELFSVEALAMFVRPYDRLFTGWPDLAFKLWHAVLWLERIWYRQRFGPGVNLGCLLAVNPSAIIVPVRIVSALLGAGTAAIAGRIAADLLPERATAAGLWATAIYAANYLVCRDGHFAVSDPFLCFAAALALLACLRATSHSPWWLVAAAFFAGTAFSIKYSAVALAFPCTVAAVELAQSLGRRALRQIACAVTAAVAGVLVWSPEIVTRWSEFREGFLGHLGRYHSATTSIGLVFYSKTILPTAFGWSGLLLCLVGLGWCARRRRGVSLMTYVAMYYLCVLGPLRLSYARYASPLVPALAAAGGVAAAILTARLSAFFSARLSGRLSTRLSARGPRALALIVVALLALAAPTARSVAFARLMARPDTRDLARDWLTAHYPGQIVLTEGVYAQVHAVDASVDRVCRKELPQPLWRPVPVLPAPTGNLAPAPGELEGSVNPQWLGVRLANRPAVAGMGEAGWARIGFLGSQRFVVWEYDQRVGLADLHDARAPDLLSRAHGPPALDWTAGKREAETIDACWRAAARFSPGEQDATTWDSADAMLVPFSDFCAVERPGPEIVIYENACKGARSPVDPG
jgi:hypothetical protein